MTKKFAFKVYNSNGLRKKQIHNDVTNAVIKAFSRTWKGKRPMNNIQVANETMRIYNAGKYEVNGKEIPFPDGNYGDVEVITPSMGEDLINEKIEIPSDRPMCKLTVINSDSYAAAKDLDRALVLNFANAHKAGGGFRAGANAQEEALCRCSTLYKSITSDKAKEMYSYNNTHASRVESDYMLISDDVLVFRNEHLALLEEPFMTSVITIPAPNKYGAAVFASSSLINETFRRRIRIMVKAAIKRGYKNMVLGAWGCGAFGNKPSDVAGFFREIIVDEGYGRLFEEVRFAIYGSEDGKNITAFRKVFEL